MRLTVRYLGPAASFSGIAYEVLEFKGIVSVEEVMETIAARRNYQFKPSAWTVLVNGRGVPGQDWSRTLLKEDTELTVLPLLSGG